MFCSHFSNQQSPPHFRMEIAYTSLDKRVFKINIFLSLSFLHKSIFCGGTESVFKSVSSRFCQRTHFQSARTRQYFIQSILPHFSRFVLIFAELVMIDY